MTLTATLLLVTSGLLMMVTLFFPWWTLKFWAPQYPEGLNIIVYPTKLEGEIDIINGLNHYIGMALFSEETFPELQYFKYLIITASVVILIVAFLRNRMITQILAVLALIGGGLGIARMYYWLRTFGTNLDPRAPIEVEPFVPPIIGGNTIANFQTWSNFSFGGYLLMGCLILIVVAALWKKRDVNHV